MTTAGLTALTGACVIIAAAALHNLSGKDSASSTARPVPAEQLENIVSAARSCSTLTGARLAAQLMANSGFDAHARNPDGGEGIAGLTAPVWRQWAPWPGAARTDAKANIVALAHHMCDLAGHLRLADVDGDPWRLALAAYDSGIAAVRKARTIPAGAVSYVDTVAGYAAWYADRPELRGSGEPSPSEPSPTPSDPGPTSVTLSPTAAAPSPTAKPSRSATPKPVPPSPTRSPQPAPSKWTTLTVTATQVLLAGESWRTNRTQLLLKPDGDLVIRDENGRERWRSNTAGKGGQRAVFQADGHFVVYTAYNQTVWSSGTAGHDGAVLVLRSDGNVVITINGQVLWQSGTQH